jgi:ribosomal protein S18 acetylase RimI-like enzyme
VAPTTDVHIEVGTADLARSLVGPICTLYDVVFSAPPFVWRDDESELHRERLVTLLDDPTFGVAVAHVADELVGFAYGFTLPVVTKRWTYLVVPLPTQLASEWPNRTFVLFDFAVHQAYRGRGIGRILHDALLGSRSEQRATLTVQPTAIDTKCLYERWGWRQVGQMEGGATAAAPMFDVYLRDRLDDLSPVQSKP